MGRETRRREWHEREGEMKADLQGNCFNMKRR
jgi:hypothetical protein